MCRWFWFFSMIFLFTACSTQPFPAQVTQTAQTAMQEQFVEAQDDFNAKRFDLARQRLEYILERDPEFPGVAEMLAQIPTPTLVSHAPEAATSFVADRIATVIAIQTATTTPYPLLTETPAPTITHPNISKTPPALLGTALPISSAPIELENYQNLTYTGQWGKGNILGIAFAPDGNSFVVGSAFGMAIYDARNIESAPKWMLFDPPFVYNSLSFSDDGQYVLLYGENQKQVRRFSDGEVVPYSVEMKWVKVSKLVRYDDNQATSLDGARRFESTTTHDEDFWDIEFSIRRIYDTASGKLLFELPDETMYVKYKDHSRPEGCDLYTFSMCGNVYSPSAMTPYRVAFSPAGDTLGVLYRAWNLWNSNRYSVVRVYDASTGKYLNQMGSFEKPVETFTYAPDGRILIGYVNGATELWSAGGKQITYSAWHFNAPIDAFSYSKDGNYAYIQREGNLEVRRTSDGALYKRYDASIFALSPVENLVAIADTDGNIRLQYLNGEKPDLEIQAHKADIYALEFSPDGKMLVSAGHDCAIRAWNVKTGQFLHPFEKTVVNAYGEDFTASRIFVRYFRFVPGTDQLLGFGSWGTVVSWNIHSGATNYVTTSEPLEYYQGMITLNPHFPEFFGVDVPNSVFYINNLAYDLNTGQPKGEFEAPKQLETDCTPVGPISADGKLMFTIGYDQHEGEVCILDANDYHLLDTIVVIPPESIYENTPPYNLINWLFLSPDGKNLVVDTVSGTLLVYQTVP